MLSPAQVHTFTLVTNLKEVDVGSFDDHACELHSRSLLHEWSTAHSGINLCSPSFLLWWYLENTISHKRHRCRKMPGRWYLHFSTRRVWSGSSWILSMNSSTVICKKLLTSMALLSSSQNRNIIQVLQYDLNWEEPCRTDTLVVQIYEAYESEAACRCF